MQANCDAAFRSIANALIIDGVLVKNIVFSGSVTQTVNHGLGRTPSGFITVDRTADSRLYRVSWNDTTITLTATAAATFALWIF